MDLASPCTLSSSSASLLRDTGLQQQARRRGPRRPSRRAAFPAIPARICLLLQARPRLSLSRSPSCPRGSSPFPRARRIPLFSSRGTADSLPLLASPPALRISPSWPPPILTSNPP